MRGHREGGEREKCEGGDDAVATSRPPQKKTMSRQPYYPKKTTHFFLSFSPFFLRTYTTPTQAIEKMSVKPLPPVHIGGAKLQGSHQTRTAPNVRRTRATPSSSSLPAKSQQPARTSPGPGQAQSHKAAAQSYEKEKSRLVSRYQKKRTQLVSRGVFDQDANTIRAENMLMTALGKIRMTTLCKNSAKDAPTPFDTHKNPRTAQYRDSNANEDNTSEAERGSEDTPQKPMPADTMAGKIQRELNVKHNERLHQMEAEEVGRRTKPDTQPKRKHDAALASEDAVNMLAHMLDPSACPSSSVMSQLGEIAKNTTHDDDSCTEDKPKPKTRTSSEVELEQYRQRMVTEARMRDSHDVDFSAAEWLQKQWEHVQYTPVEARLHQRAKQADDLTRPNDVVMRYTEPRRWMTSANKYQSHEASGEGGAMHDAEQVEEGHNEPTGKGVRRESDLAPATVTGGRQMWERNAAVLSVEDMLHSPSLAEVIDAGLVRSATAGGADIDSAPPPVPNPRQLVYSPTYKGKARMREVFREANHDELTRQRKVVHASVKHHESFEGDKKFGLFSGDSDDEHVEEKLPPTASYSQQTEQETLSLLEGVITFMCKEFNLRRTGRGNPTATVKIMRNLLIQSLRTLIPALVSRIAEAQDSQQATKWSGVADPALRNPARRFGMDDERSQGEEDGALEHRIWLLRTWAKGAEVLLTWDLALDGPFTVVSEDHFNLFVRYYTGLRRKIHHRTQRLLVRWKTAQDVGETFPDPEAESRHTTAKPPPTAKPRAKLQTVGRGAKGENARSPPATCDADPEQHFASQYYYSKPQGDAKAAAETAEKKASIAKALSRVAVDGSDPQMANAVRQFMAKLGFVPSGPAGGVVQAETSSAISRLRTRVMASAIHDQLGRASGLTDRPIDELDDTQQLPPELESSVTPIPCNLYFGAVLSHTTKIFVVTADVTRAHSCKNTSGLVEDSSERARSSSSPYAKGTLLVCMAEEGEWVQMRNGYYVPAADVMRSDDTTGQVLQHSADNANMRRIVGAREARQRQRAQLLNGLLSVITHYARLTSRHCQERFVQCVKEESARPIVPEEESRMDRLLCYDSEDSEDDLSNLKEAEQRAKETQVEEESHKVAKDMLVRKYGAQFKTPSRLQRQQLLDNPTMWSSALEPNMRAAYAYSEHLTEEKVSPTPDPVEEGGGDGGSGDSDSNLSDAVVPSLTSTLSDGETQGGGDDSATSESAQVSKYMGEIDRVLQTFKWGFQRRHDISKEWSNLPIRELAHKSRLWRRCQNVYQSRQIALSNLLKKLESEPALMAAPHILTKMCKKVSDLGQRLENSAQKVHELTGDVVLIESLSLSELLERDSKQVEVAIEKAKQAPAAQVMASYLDTGAPTDQVS